MTPMRWVRIIRGRWSRGAAAAALVAGALWPATPSPLAALVRVYRANPTPARRAAVETYAAAHPSDRDLARLALGVTDYEQKDYVSAAVTLRGLAAQLPLVGDYAAYYLAAARVETADVTGLPEELAAVHAGTVSPLASNAWIIEARSLETTAAARAIETLREHYKDLPQPEGDLTLADAYRTANDLPHACELYRRVYTEYPLGAAAGAASAALAALETAMGPAFPRASTESAMRRADRLFELRGYPQARAAYEAAAGVLSGAQRDVARVRIGGCDLGAGRPGPAAAYLNGLQVEDAEANAERLYDLEECARRLNNEDAAASAVRRLGEKYAQSPWRVKALQALAGRYLAQNRPDDYLPLYRAIYTDFPGEPGAAASHWRITFVAYMRGDPDAEALLRAHLESYATHGTSAAALYFLGRLYQSRGDAGSARACYERLTSRLPNSYYAMQARRPLNEPEIARASVAAATADFLNALPFPAIPEFPATPTSATTLRIDRARMLRSAGLSELADAELRFGARTDAQPALAAMEIAAWADAAHLAMKTMKAMTPDYLSRPLPSAPRQFWEYLFPLPYRTEIAADARAHKLDPALVAGLIRQESEFNPGAISSANARGLMQVQTGTGREVARAVGLTRVTPGMLLQPEPNVKIGTAVFRAMLDKNGGNMEKTLAAYNAGPRHAEEWMSWNTYREPAEFIESIPFTETRDYVQAVLRNAEMYRRLYSP
jgi:soluble lytic murein transglycosylase